MNNKLKFSHEIDWEFNINQGLMTDRSIKFQRNVRESHQKTSKFKKKNLFHFFSVIQKKVSGYKLVSLFYGFLFIVIFVFLFFLSISFTFATSFKQEKIMNNQLYNEFKTDKLLENYLINDRQKEDNGDIDSDDNISNHIIKKIEYQTYRVLKNDNYNKIAKKFGLRVDTILLVNYIQSLSNLRIGTRLVIPNQDGRVVTVRYNDTIFKIANRYGISWEKIVDVNGLTSSVIFPRMKLFVPGSTMSRYEKNLLYNRKFIWPIRGRITSYFGKRIDPFTGVYNFHTGIDIKNREGAQVKVIDDGEIIFTGWQKIYGNFIIVKHTGNFLSTYAHLSKILVRKGQKVSLGEYIGLVGSTGRSTGSHLHLEIRKRGKLVNPLSHLK